MIYIDLGAYTGDTVDKFLRSHPRITEVWAFEPYPYTKEWDDIKRAYPNVEITLINKAAWIKDEELDFSVHANPHSHTIVSDCVNYKDGGTVKVAAIDFVTWFTELYKLSYTTLDYVIVKIDVEGAEYAILERLIETGIISAINELYVEFHDWIMPAEYAARHAKIVAECPIPIHGWE